ncbi:MAG: HIT domain-containing protein [Puniceicoccaceae bacterium]
MAFENLHAHWRMPYVAAPSSAKEEKPHLFASIPEELDERSSLLIHRGSLSYLVMNRYPYNAGHLLAVPYREVPDLEDLSPAEFTDLHQTILFGKKLLRHALAPHGFNIGYNLGSAAGAGIPRHLHCHIVPRWNGDTNFMPVVADTRVLPIAMESMWEVLRKALPEITNS